MKSNKTTEARQNPKSPELCTALVLYYSLQSLYNKALIW